MKKIVSVILTILIISLAMCFFASCSSDDNTDSGDVLGDILQKYKKNGLTSWWEIAAIYNAGENPADYKGFEDLYLSLESTANIKMASYVIVANMAIISGEDSSDFDKYEEYKTNLKNLLENPTDKYTVNDYIFGYYALKSSGIKFDQTQVHGYLHQSQKPDGGFALSGDSGDVDVTAFAIPAIQLMLLPKNDGDIEKVGGGALLTFALGFLENQINENGTFSCLIGENENANSTACALSALVSWHKDGWELSEPAKKAVDGLELFRVKDKKETGYCYLIDGKTDILATAQAAIALGDLKNKTSVWVKLYLDSQTVFNID